MAYVIGTTESTVRWYAFKHSERKDPAEPLAFELLDQLDLRKVMQAGDKATAKGWAQAAGLKIWRYVRI